MLLPAPLESLLVNRASSRGEVGNSVFFSNCAGKLGVPLELQQRSHASTRVERGHLGVLSTFSRGVGPPLELLWRTQCSSQVKRGDSEYLLCCSGNSCSSQVTVPDSGFHLIHGGELGIPLDLWGYSGFLSTYSGASSRVVLQQLISSKDVQYGSCLVSMLGGNSLVLAWDFPIVLVGVSCSCGGFNSPVVECKLLSTCGVRFVSVSSRMAPLYM